MRTEPGAVRRPARRRVATGAVVALLLGLTACTGPARTVGEAVALSTVASSTGAATPAGGAVGAPSEQPGSSGSGAASDGAGSDGPAPKRTETGGPGPTGLAPDGAADGLAAPPSGKADPAEVALERQVPGFYGLASIGAAVHGHTVSIAAAGDCGFVMEVIRAGQWSVHVIDQPHGQGQVWVAVLTLSGRTALLVLDSSSAACTGTITLDRSAALTISGAATATGAASYLPLLCMPVRDEDLPSTQTVFGVYLTADRGYLLTVQTPDAVGSHQLPTGDDVDAGVVMAPLGTRNTSVGIAAVAFAAIFDPVNAKASDGEAIGRLMLDGWTSSGAAAAAGVVVTSQHPLRGRFTGRLTNPDKPASTVKVQADFGCDG